MADVNLNFTDCDVKIGKMFDIHDNHNVTINTNGPKPTTQTEPMVELSYEGMPGISDNDIVGNCYHGILVDTKWLWAVVNTFVVKNMENKYEWMSVYYFLREVGLLIREDFTNFGKVMEQWYSEMPNYKPCTPDIVSNHHYMLTEPLENWKEYVCNHVSDKRFKSSLNVCVKTIPQIKNLLSVFYSKYPNKE